MYYKQANQYVVKKEDYKDCFMLLHDTIEDISVDVGSYNARQDRVLTIKVKRPEDETLLKLLIHNDNRFQHIVTNHFISDLHFGHTNIK